MSRMNQTTEAAAGLSPEELQALAQKLLSGRRRSDRQAVARRPRSGKALPLSFEQQRLWFLERLGGVGSAYNLGTTLSLEGTLESEALERAFGEVVRRHEILRTR